MGRYIQGDVCVRARARVCVFAYVCMKELIQKGRGETAAAGSGGGQQSMRGFVSREAQRRTEMLDGQ